MKSLRILALAAVILGTAGSLTLATAAALDTPTINLVEIRRAELVVDVVAGPSGAPAGFTIEWMTKAEYDLLGWPDVEYAPPVIWCKFYGDPQVTTWGDNSSYRLGPNETARIQVGDLFDEWGMYVNDTKELDPGVSYVFRIHAEGTADAEESAYSDTYVLTTESNPQDCTYTVGYWKTHGPGDCAVGGNTNNWPVAGLMLGTVFYTDAELCAILNTPAAGNGLLILAHQLIATKLNLANGANPLPVIAFVNAADALIGGLVCPPIGGGSLPPGTVSALTDQLDDYNNGLSGVPHCGVTATEATTLGRMKAIYR